jgi:hypothetical protein
MPKSGTNRSSTAVVQTRRVRPERNYTDIPNDLIRGSGIYGMLCPEERIILMAGLSCRDGYETTLDRIEDWLADATGKTPGRNRQEAFRRTLREQGFLVTERGNIPAGRPDGGRIMWTYTFFQEPLPIDQRDVLPAKKVRSATIADAAEGADEQNNEIAGQTMPLDSGHGEGAEGQTDKTPAQTTPPQPGHGQPGHGQPGPGDDRVYKEEKDYGLEELKTSSSLSSSEPTAAAPPAKEEEATNIDDEQQTAGAAVLGAIFDRQHVATARRTTGTRHAHLAALAAERLAAGWTHDQLVRALDEPLVGVDSIFAVMRHRLTNLGVTPPAAPAPRRQKPRCDKGGAHAPYPADGCVICTDEVQDRKVRDAIEKADTAARQAEAETETKVSGIAAARAAAAAAGTGKKPTISRWTGRGSAPAQAGTLFEQVTTEMVNR